MTVFTNLSEIRNIEPTAVALGNFDGVHKGHQALIAKAAEAGRKNGLKTAVFTFTNHPANVISGKTKVKNIMNFEEKVEAVAKYDVDYLFSVDFDDMMRTSSPLVFCRDILSNILRAQIAVCGFNYSFAYKAEGNPQILSQFGKEFGYKTYVIDPVCIDGKVVSSTLIRRSIDEGRVDEYVKYTGRPYDIEGIVIHGKHLGHRIGFPTVNLALSSEMAQPLNGVYVTKTYVNLCDEGFKVYPSVTNVGNKPTVGIFDKNAETHIFGFNEDIYGEKIKVEFIKLIRSEQKFDSFDDLQEQIHKDCLFAREYHNNQIV